MGTYIDIKTNRNIPTVANFSALPAPASAVNEYYWVLASQGTAYPLGLYYSNGITWSHMVTPVQATQVEVDAGVNEDKFVSPKTLKDSVYFTQFEIGVNFLDVETFNYRAPENFTIDTIDNPDGLVLTIEVNGNPYVLGTLINYLDTLEITPDIVGFIKLNCSR